MAMSELDAALIGLDPNEVEQEEDEVEETEAVEGAESDEEPEEVAEAQEEAEEPSEPDVEARLAELERARDGLQRDLISKRQQNADYRDKLSKMEKLLEEIAHPKEPPPSPDDDPIGHLERTISEQVGKVDEKLAALTEEQRITAAGNALGAAVVEELGGDQAEVSAFNQRLGQVAAAYRDQLVEQGASVEEATRQVRVAAIVYANQAKSSGQKFTDFVNGIYEQSFGPITAGAKPKAVRSDAKAVKKGVRGQPLSTSAKGGSGDTRYDSEKDWDNIPTDLKARLLRNDDLWREFNTKGGMTASEIRSYGKR